MQKEPSTVYLCPLRLEGYRGLVSSKARFERSRTANACIIVAGASEDINYNVLKMFLVFQDKIAGTNSQT